jgi:membrane-associated phospholipid phosphatase
VAALNLRRSEWLLASYFTYAVAAAWILPVPPGIPLLTLAVNICILASFFLVAYADSLRQGRFLATLRDWYPMPLLVLAYREIGWFAPAQHSYELERVWVAWDKFLLNDLGFKAAIESMGPLLPSVLDLSYILVYAIPYFALGVLYCCGCRERAERFTFPFAFAVLFAYVLFPFFPSEPPRTVFPGEDFPSFDTVFRRLNWSLLASYGIHTSVFPSAHCSGAFAAALAMRLALPEKRWAWKVLLVMACLIATATVYGRYHYLADAAAGLAIALLAWGMALLAERGV